MTDEIKCEVCLGKGHDKKDCLGFINLRKMMYTPKGMCVRVDTFLGIFCKSPKNVYRFSVLDGEPLTPIGVEKCIIGILQYAHSLGEMKIDRSFVPFEGLDYFTDYLYNRMNILKVESLFALYGMNERKEKNS